MSKLFIGICLLIHAVSAAAVIAIGENGIWLALGIMVSALVANTYLRKNATGELSEQTLSNAKAGLVYATFYTAMGAGWYASFASQDLAWAYLLLPVALALLYCLQLHSVHEGVKLAAEFAENEAKRRAIRAEIDAARQNGQT